MVLLQLVKHNNSLIYLWTIWDIFRTLKVILFNRMKYSLTELLEITPIKFKVSLMELPKTQ